MRGCFDAPDRAGRRARLLCVGGAIALLGGCLWDYTWGGGYRPSVRTVAVPIFDNKSIRRGHEFDLTQAVAREIVTRTPYRIVADPAQADVVVRGTIVQFTQPALALGVTDTVVQGSVRIEIEVRLVEGRTGKVVAEPAPYAEWASLVPARGETLDTARAEVLDKLARWVVRQLEEPW